MKHCVKCCMPETKDGITFSDEGVCNVCVQVANKHQSIDWEERGRMLDKLCDKFRGKGDYDCVVPFSGGKDSTFTLWYLIKKQRLRPLVVCFDHGFYRSRHLENRARTLKKLGCDSVIMQAGWKVVRETMLESLRRKGDFCWHCHCGVYAGSMQLAVKFGIPLVFWGQPNAEYGSYGYTFDEIEVVDERQFNRYINLGMTAEDMAGMLPPSIEARDLAMFKFPSFEAVRALGMVSVRLGSFIPWDLHAIGKIIAEELGWEGNRVEGVPPEYSWEKVECMFTGVRDYLKFIKRGFGRTTHLVSIDIREGRMDREKALRLIREFDGKRPASLDTFLKLLDLSEEEFMDIALSHCVAPYKHDPAAVPRGEALVDQDEWRSMLGLA